MKQTFNYLALALVIIISSTDINAQNNILTGSTHGLMVITEYSINENRDKTFNAAPLDKNHPVGLGATAKMFLTALYQEAAPVLIPAPLMQVIRQHTEIAHTLVNSSTEHFYQTHCLSKRFKEFSEARLLHDYANYLYKLYNAAAYQARQNVSDSTHEQAFWDNPLFDQSSTPPSFDDGSSTWHEAITYLICYFAPWNKYEVRAIKQGYYTFYLCIPKRLLSSSKPERTMVKRALNYEQYSTVEDPIHTTFCVPQGDSVTLQSGYDEALYKTLQQLLVQKTGTNSGPVLTFYFMGHGIFCNDACEKIQEQVADQTRCLRDRSKFEAEETRWQNESAQWKQKQHVDREYDSTRKGYIIYDQQAIKHNIEACQQNIRTCKHNQQVCDQNLKSIEHNLKSLTCANTVAGISQLWFKKIVQFLDTRVTTNMLFYRSCSAGGQQLIDLFTDENNKPMRLSYTVVVGTLCEAVSSTFSPIFHLTWFKNNAKNLHILIPIDKLIDKQRHTVALDSLYDLNNFFEQTRSRNSSDINLKSLIESVNPVSQGITKTTNKDSSWFSVIKDGFDSVVKKIFGSNETPEDFVRKDIANIPSIRLPYETEFHVIDMHNVIIPLTTKDLSNTSSNVYTVSAPHEIVMLYTPMINKILHITQREYELFPAFISMIAGPAHHTILAIDASSYNLSSVFDGFFTCSELQVPKLFYIKSISAINDIISQIPLGLPQTISNVYIFNCIDLHNKKCQKTEDPVNGIMFDCQGITHFITWPNNKPVPHKFELKRLVYSDQKNIVDIVSKQCVTKQQDQYVEPLVPVLTIADLQKKVTGS